MSEPVTYDAVDDVFAEVVRIQSMGAPYCDDLPWSVLDEADQAKWLLRGRRYREALEARGVVVTAREQGGDPFDA